MTHGRDQTVKELHSGQGAFFGGPVFDELPTDAQDVYHAHLRQVVGADENKVGLVAQECDFHLTLIKSYFLRDSKELLSSNASYTR
jgi:hypothetical protein